MRILNRLSSYLCTRPLRMLFGLALVLPVLGQAVWAQNTELGYVSLERVVPANGAVAGTVGFRVANLTGSNSLPPEAGVTTAVTLQGAQLTYTVQGAAPVTVGLGDIGPGSPAIPLALNFPDTTVFTAAELRATLSTRVVSVTGTATPVLLGSASIVVTVPPTVGTPAPILSTYTAARQLTFGQQPGAGNAGVALAPAVTVRIVEADGSATTSTASVTLTSTPSGVSATVAAVAGTATFDSLVFGTQGSYTLTATSSGLVSATSNSFTIGPPVPSRLTILTPPAGGVVGAAIAPVAVQILGSTGGATTSTASVTVTSTPTGVTATAAAVNGTATFSGLVFSQLGSYTLTATSAGLTSFTTPAFSISGAAAGTLTLTSDRTVYGVGQTVTLRGRLTAPDGSGISAAPVVVVVTRNGGTRTLSTNTGSDGSYAVTFAPATTEAGSLQARATSGAGGVTKTATASFRVAGLLLISASPAVDLVMGTTARPAFTVQNAGDGALSGLNITVTASSSALLSSRLNLAGVTTGLGLGASQGFTLDLTASPGNPPANPVPFVVTATAVDVASGVAVSEVASVTVTLRAATTSQLLSPANATLGVNPGGTATQQYTVRNDGYVAIPNAVVQLQNPGASPWVSLADASLGRIEPGQTKTFRVIATPPGVLTAATYSVPFTVSGGAVPLTAALTVNVNTGQTGSATFNIQNDLGLNVTGATVTTISKANPATTFQGATDGAGNVTLTGVTAGDYNYVVTAPHHSPRVGSVRVTAGGSAQGLSLQARSGNQSRLVNPDPTPVTVILSYDVVTLSFAVTPTTVADIYDTELRVLYSTFLVKPVLRVTPVKLDYKFPPQARYDGSEAFPYPQCIQLEVENLHPTSKVTEVTLDATQLDAGIPEELKFRLKLFAAGTKPSGDGSTTFSLGTLSGRDLPYDNEPFKKLVQACGTVVPDYLEDRDLGSMAVSGKYEYSAPQAVKMVGTTTTPVPVSYQFPVDLWIQPINLINENGHLRPMDENYPLYKVTSLRSQTAQVLTQTATPFNGHQMVGYPQENVAPKQLRKSRQDFLTIGLNRPLWYEHFIDQPSLAADVPAKASFTRLGDTAYHNIEKNDALCAPATGAGSDVPMSLVACLESKMGADPAILGRPLYVGFAAQWSDRGTGSLLPGEDGYKVPVNIYTPGAPVLVSGGAGGAVIPLPRTCTAENVPGQYLPVECGQILIAIDFKQRFERQAFNAALGVAPAVPLSNVQAGIKVTTLDGQDAGSQFTIVVSKMTQGVSGSSITLGSISAAQELDWQLIPKAGAGGTTGTKYKVTATFSYVVGGQTQNLETAPVTITVSPLPQLEVTYSVPFLVIQKKPAKIRVGVENKGNGPANNLSVSSLTPVRVLSRPGLTGNPQLPTTFNLTGASSTADGSTYQAGVNEVLFGSIAPGAKAAGFFNLVVDVCLENPLDDSTLWRQVTDCGFIVDSTATMTQRDLNGVKLDPLLSLAPFVKFLPVLGGTVRTTSGPRNGLIVNVRSVAGNQVVGSDTTDTDGGYFIQDLPQCLNSGGLPVSCQYMVTVTNSAGTVLATTSAEVLADSSTNFLDFTVTPPAGSPVPVTVGTSPAGLTFSVDGVSYQSAQTFTWATGSTHTLVTNASQQKTGVAGTLYNFGSWSNSGSILSSVQNPAVPAPPSSFTATVTATGPGAYLATFNTQYELKLNVSPASSGRINSPLDGQTGSFITAGSTVSLTAAANTGYQFSAFSGDVTGATNPATFVMSGPKTVTANFTPLAPILSTSITARTGTADARSWTLTVSNSGIGVGLDTRIASLSVVAAGAPGCTTAPRVVTPMPVVLGTIGSLTGSQTGAVIVDVSGCPTAQRFTVTVGISANNGAYTKSTTFNNQLR